jgi:hypothetical protein
MTPQQEAILDRLMAATISRDWSGGPLHVAALAMDPAFQLPANRDMRRQIELSRRMGFSRLFCEAMHGANAGLANEDDRRKLAITVFSVLSPKAPPRKIAAALARDVAIWMAFRAHELVCSGPCELREHITARVTEYREGRQVTGGPSLSPTSYSYRVAYPARCATFPAWKGDRVFLNCAASYCSVTALWHLHKGLQAQNPPSRVPRRRGSPPAPRPRSAGPTARRNC